MRLTDYELQTLIEAAEENLRLNEAVFRTLTERDRTYWSSKGEVEVWESIVEKLKEER